MPHGHVSELPNGWASASLDASAGDYLALLKPRVMSLVVFTAVVGMFLAPGSLHPLISVVAIICIAVGAGASGAINMWFDRDIDAVMERTVNRPIPAGRISPENALAFGILLAIGSITILGLIVNWTAGGLLALTIGFYIFIYTMWLKRRTAQNIVIGGAAGAFPPMIGWAAVSGQVSLESALLFLIIFMWTPPHFWALALYRTGDYQKAGVPMLPVIAGQRETKKQILIYTLFMVPISFSPLFAGMSGWIYGTAAGLLSAYFLYCAVAVWRTSDDVLSDGADKKAIREQDRTAKRMFGFSILYLFGLFVALVVDRLLAVWI
jgi:protoheme IX farnesyltransferase